MSDTPRVNALIEEHEKRKAIYFPLRLDETIALARELERELASANRSCDACLEEIDRLRAERDGTTLDASTPLSRSRKALEGVNVRKVLEGSNLPVEIATAIADALEAPRPEGGWISIKDRLPEERRIVLVWEPRLENCWTAYIEHGEWRFAETGGRNLSGVTHWQPMPEPPTSVERTGEDMKLALGITLLLMVIGILFAGSVIEHGWIAAAIVWAITLTLVGMLALAAWLIATA